MQIDKIVSVKYFVVKNIIHGPYIFGSNVKVFTQMFACVLGPTLWWLETSIRKKKHYTYKYHKNPTCEVMSWWYWTANVALSSGDRLARVYSVSSQLSIPHGGRINLLHLFYLFAPALSLILKYTIYIQHHSTKHEKCGLEAYIKATWNISLVNSLWPWPWWTRPNVTANRYLSVTRKYPPTIRIVLKLVHTCMLSDLSCIFVF